MAKLKGSKNYMQLYRSLRHNDSAFCQEEKSKDSGAQASIRHNHPLQPFQTSNWSFDEPLR
uniref:Uncharacterized protein n=1 Tax=Manihot esculenta TaxID=3983 RepID=A0A2C9VFD6_MANES